MTTPYRWKRLFVLGAGTTSLAVILWAAYLFTAIWLRVRCARELDAQAEPLAEFSLDDIQTVESDDTANLNISASNIMLWNTTVRSHNPLERLESLQRPSVGTVFRHLLGRDDRDDTTKLQTVQSIAFSPQGQVLATGGSSTSTVQVWNAQTGAPQSGSVAFSVTASPASNSAGQFLARIALWEPGFDSQCHSVTDSHGEKVLVVTRPLSREPSEVEVSEPLPQDREVLLIDSTGRIFARLCCPGASLVGKLVEPLGKADQLVFGTQVYVTTQNHTLKLKVAGPGAVCIIEEGQLKTVRSIPGSVSPPTEPKTTEPPTNE